MSIKAIGPKKWEIRAQWYDPKTGRKRGAKETFSGSEREAKRRDAEFQKEAREEGGNNPSQRLEAFARLWLETRLAKIKPSVSKRYASALDLHILPALGKHFLDKLERADVQQYVLDRAKTGAAGHTVRNELQVLRTMAREAHADGLCPKNWADRVSPPKLRKWTEEDPNLLSGAQLYAVLSAVPRKWLPAVTLSAYSGLRWGELSATRRKDVDASGKVKIRRSNWRGIVGDPKNESSRRSVVMPPIVAQMLLEDRPTGKPDDLLFPNRKGKLYKGWPLVKVMKKACAAAGVPYTTPHGLRRTFNNLSRRIADAMVVKSMTGHSTDAMHEHYSMISFEEKAELVKMLVTMVEDHKHSGEAKAAANRVKIESDAATDVEGERPNAE